MDLLQRDGYRLRAPEPEDLGVMMFFENTPSLSKYIIVFMLFLFHYLQKKITMILLL